MSKLAKYTKLNPDDRVKKTNQFLNLLIDPNKKLALEENEEAEEKKNSEENSKKKKDQLSAKEKSEKYGIQIKELKESHKAYYMKDTILIDKDKSKIKNLNKPFDLVSKKNMKKWLCIYRTSDNKKTKNIIFKKAENFYNTLYEASKGYNIEISEPEWVEMKEEDDDVNVWNETVEDYMNNGNYTFVIFLLDNYDDYLYTDLKIHSLCNNGYVSQIVKFNSLNKNAMSVCSKILLQINSKLSGVSYLVKFEDEIKKRKLMIIGVDSSHIKGKRTGFAMVATINTSFTNFCNKEIIIEEANKEKLQIGISVFIKEALAEYKKLNGKLPNGIIIYRQGVSFQQKEYLKNEVKNIQKVCEENKILYYYILVNTKTTYKFFEIKDSKYKNPEGGLLVLDGVTNRNFFEFYIQPQKVTGGRPLHLATMWLMVI